MFQTGVVETFINMSKAYTSDGRRRSSMTHARRTWRCTCGRTVAGNGGKSSHRRACPDHRYLTQMEAYRLRAEEGPEGREDGPT